ncbi:speckle-type poz protein [Anaeramoeba ignava]|uniref:Speckle-type poz protein n=1 Tax=Anaeramoeba ignava TaxID=1746090 RepID=A0A9Q0LS26_ANAIG|nr:speckle-type poz protein [Anaeramoeba ignava]
MEQKYFIQVKNYENKKVKLTNQNEIIVEWKLSEQFQPKSNDKIALFDATKEKNEIYFTYKNNSNSQLEGTTFLNVNYVEIWKNKLQIRYLPENQSKSILVSEVFEIIPFEKIITIDEINEKEIKTTWKLPVNFIPNGDDGCDGYSLRRWDLICLFPKDEPFYSSSYLGSVANYNATMNGTATFNTGSCMRDETNEEFVIRYIAVNEDTIAESEPFIIKSKIPENHLILSKEKFLFGESIEVSWEFPEDFEISETSRIGLFYENSISSQYIELKYIYQTNRKDSIIFQTKDYQTINFLDNLQFRFFSCDDKSQCVSKPFQIQFLENNGIEIIAKRPTFGLPIQIQFKLPDEYKPNISDSISLFYYDPHSNLNDLSQKPLIEKHNDRVSRIGMIEFKLDDDLKKENTNENEAQLFIVKYISHLKTSNEKKVLFTSSHFGVDELKIFKLLVSKNEIKYGESIDVKWEFPEYYQSNERDWIGLFLKDSPINNSLVGKATLNLTKKGILRFDIGNYITEENQIFEFRYYPKDQKNPIAKSEEIKVKEFNKKNFKLLVSKNEIKFGESINVEWEFPEYYHSNEQDWIGLFLKDSPINNSLFRKFTSNLAKKGILTLDIGNYITEENQIFEIRYYPKDQKNPIAKSEEIKVKEFDKKDFKLLVSKNEIKYGESIDVEWELPESYRPIHGDRIVLFLKYPRIDSNSLIIKDNSNLARKGKFTFDIDKYIKDENQIFEFRYIKFYGRISLMKSEEIKVKEIDRKDFKLSVSKNEIKFGELIDVEWEIPEYHQTNSLDRVGLFLKDSTTTPGLTDQYIPMHKKKGILTFDIGNYIREGNQIFEFRYCSNEYKYKPFAKSEEIKVLPLEGGIIKSSPEKTKIGETIKVSWELPNNYEPHQNDQIILFKSQLQSKEKEAPKYFQVYYKNEKCEKKGEVEIKIQIGGGMIEEEFIIGYYSYSYSKIILCQSPIIIEPTSFVGIKILNRKIVGDKIQFVWSLPSVITPLETDRFVILSTKNSKFISIISSNLLYNISLSHSGISELSTNQIKEKDIMQDFAIGYIRENKPCPFIESEFFRFEFPILSKNLQIDLFNLFLRQEFCDFTINHLDGNIQVHKLILLMRFDNDHSILTKIQEVFSSKPENQVIPFLIFIYTGMIDPISNLDLNQFQKDEWNLIESKHPFFSFYWKSNQFNFDDSDSQKLFQEYLTSSDNFSQIQNEKKIQIISQELGFDKNWIQNKKDESGIKKDFVNLYLEKIEKKDFKIICDDSSEIKVHKLILILRSNLFRQMFLNVQDDSNSVKDYSGKSKGSLEQLIHYFYFGEFDLNLNLNLKKDLTKIIQELNDTEDFYQLSQFNQFNNRLKELETQKYF